MSGMLGKTVQVLLWCVAGFILGGSAFPVEDQVRKQFALDGFYTQAVMVGGFPIVASDKVSPVALEEAEWIIRGMLEERPDILKGLAKTGTRFAVMAVEERTVDVPEHSDLTPPEWWNRRARGLGATKVRPAVSCGEENLLCCPGDPYATENILVHEFAHAIHDMGLRAVDPAFDGCLEKLYQRAMAAGLWKGKYAATNRHEYWAEAVQSWFGTNREDDHDHNHVNTREELIAYDPAVARLCAEVFGLKNDWRYVRPDDPSRIGKGHLKGLDRTKLPRFAWTAAEKKALQKKGE